MQKQQKKTNRDLKESKKSNTGNKAIDDEREIKEFIHRLKLQRELLKNFIDPSTTDIEIEVVGQEKDEDEKQITDNDEGQVTTEKRESHQEHSVTGK